MLSNKLKNCGLMQQIKMVSPVCPKILLAQQGFLFLEFHKQPLSARPQKERNLIR